MHVVNQPLFPPSLKAFLEGFTTSFETEMHKTAELVIHQPEYFSFTKLFHQILSSVHFDPRKPDTLFDKIVTFGKGLFFTATYFNSMGLNCLSRAMYSLGLQRSAYYSIYFSRYFAAVAGQMIDTLPFPCLVKTMNFPQLSTIAPIYDQLLSWENPDLIPYDTTMRRNQSFAPGYSWLQKFLLTAWFWQPFGMDGVCAGESFWFNFVYLKNIPREADPESLLKKIASLFIVGAPKEAVFFQHFAQTFDRRPDPKPFAFVQFASKIILKPENNEEMLKNGDIFYQNINEILETMPSGAYSLILPILNYPHHTPGILHAISLIKISNELAFIFDPNNGLMKIEGENLGDKINQFFNYISRRTLHLSVPASMQGPGLVSAFESYHEWKEREGTQMLSPTDYPPFYVAIIPFSLNQR